MPVARRRWSETETCGLWCRRKPVESSTTTTIWRTDLAQTEANRRHTPEQRSHSLKAAAAAAAGPAAATRAVSSGGTGRALPSLFAGALITSRWAPSTTSAVPPLRRPQEQQRLAPSFRPVFRTEASHAETCVTISLLAQSQGLPGAPQASPPQAAQASRPEGPPPRSPEGPQVSIRAAKGLLGSASFVGASPARVEPPLSWIISRGFSSSKMKRVVAPRYGEVAMKPGFPCSQRRWSKQPPLQREQQWQQQPQGERPVAESNSSMGPSWTYMLLLGVSGTAVACWLSERRRRIEAEAAAAAAQAAAAAAAERSALGWYWPDWASFGGSLRGTSETERRPSKQSSPSGPLGDIWWSWESPRSPEAFDLIAFSNGFLPLQPHEPPWGLRPRQNLAPPDLSPWRSSAAAAEALLALNALVFVAWRVAALASKSAWGGRLLQMLMRHFLASREAVGAKRFHTLLTASVSHAAFPHILMNWMLLQLLLQQLQPMLSGPEVWGLWALSSLMGVAAHMIVSPLPVLGASSFACCLLWVEGVCRSRDFFMTVLPVPGVMLTALQLSQLNVAVNGGLYLLSRFGKGRLARALRGVSWVGHLGGIAAGCLFSAYKRHVAHDRNWGSFTNLSRTFSAADWRNTRADFADSLQILWLRIRMHLGDERNLPVLQMKFEQLRRKRQLRRAFEA
ncbi:hypothetical protein ACSSS7_000234 [Eimeria intestinalis]